MDRRLDKVIFIRRYRSHKFWIRDYAHPGLNIFDPDLCNTIVLRNWDFEFLGGGSEFGRGVKLHGLVSKNSMMWSIEVDDVKCLRTGECGVSKNLECGYLEWGRCGDATDLVIPYDFVNELLVLQCESYVISFPVVVEKLVGDFIFLFEAKLDADEREGLGFGHHSSKS